MMPRIGALSFLVALFTGGAWYVLRDTPQKRVLLLREEARSLLRNAGELERAEELNEQILKLIPGSLYDLLFKAEIGEKKGTGEGLKEALGIYDQILDSGDPNYLGVAFLKARACRVLGLMTDARAALLSVMDQYPYLALMELGETAMSAITPLEALRHFARARDVAPSKEVDEARAHEGMANAYLLLLALNENLGFPPGLSAADLKERELERERTLAMFRENCRLALEAALSFCIKNPENPASDVEARRWLIWAASLSEKLLSVRRPEDHPCQDGVVLLKSKLAVYGPILKDSTATVRVSLGALRLLAAKHEAVILPDGLAKEYQRLAVEDFLFALGKTPEEGKSLVAAASKLPVEPRGGGFVPAAPLQDEEARNYLQALSGVARVYLAIGEASRLLDDRSELALSQRITDVLAAAGQEVSGVFALFLGLARLHAGDPQAAEVLFARYAASFATDRRVDAALDIADEILRYGPPTPLVLAYLDRFEEAGGQALQFVGKKISILARARGQEALAATAEKRLDAILAAAADQARSPLEVLGLARVIRVLKGTGAAVDVLRTASARLPQDFEVHWLFVEMLREQARALEKGGRAREAQDSYREAFGVCLPLFVRSPSRSEDLLRATAEVARKVLGGESKETGVGVLRTLFPAAPDTSIADLAFAVESFLGGNYGQALDRASAMVEVRGLDPFLSFLKGASHAGLAGYLRRDLTLAKSQVARQALEARRVEHARAAMADFRSAPGFAASRLELLLLEFEELPPQGEVPDELLHRIREISDSEEAGHRGYYLLAQALRRRFVHRYTDERIRNSELIKLLAGEQKALRNCIRRYPQFNRAYIALADLFLTPEAGASAQARRGPRRNLFRPDRERAINVLKSAPEPDTEVISALAARLEAGDKAAHAEATPYLERLCRLRPEAQAFQRLLENYLRTGDPGGRVLLAESGSALEEAPAGVPKGRWEALLELRTGFEAISEYQGVRLTCLGNKTANDEFRTRSVEEKRLLRRQAIEFYTRALAAYDARGVPPPLLVFNNLAWYLTEDEDAAARARAVEIAARGRALVPEPASMPNMHDTYAWALYRNGKPVEAERMLRELVAAADEPTYRYHLARVLFELRRYDEALREIRLARDSVKDFAESEAAGRLEREISEARLQAVGEK